MKAVDACNLSQTPHLRLCRSKITSFVQTQVPSPVLFKQSHPQRQCLKRRIAVNATDSSTEWASDQSQNEDTAADSFAYRQHHALLDGNTFIITAIREDDVGPASVVLTRAFATSPQGIPFDDGKKYCKDMLKAPPDGVLLVGRLYPEDLENSEWLLRPGQTSRLIATASLSFHPCSREKFETLQPPDRDCYVCNIAVDPKFRRQGYARLMLQACEGMAKEQGHSAVYLHVRLADTAAQSLYQSSGYEVVDEDSWLVKLRNITPRALMAKKL